MPNPKILPGKHENMTAAGLRRHYEAGCRHDACTAASTAAEAATHELQAAGIAPIDVPDALDVTLQLVDEPTTLPPQTAPTQEPAADATPPEVVAPAATPPADFDVDLTDAMLAIATAAIAAAPPAPKKRAPKKAPQQATAAQVIANLMPTPAPPRTPGRTNARGTIRRVQGLIYVGFTTIQIAQATRTPVDAIWWLLLNRVDTVTDITHARIATISRDLVKHIPDAPDDRGRALAVDLGWRSYFSWDSFDTDEDAA